MRRLAVAVGAVAVLAAGGMAAFGATGDERIYACVNNGDGTMRQVAGASSTCSKGWHQISWSAENAPATPALKSYVRAGGLGPIEPGDTETNHAACDEGDVATGGGFQKQHGVDIEASFMHPHPVSPGVDVNDWFVRAHNDEQVTLQFGAFVTCLDTNQ